MKHKRLRRVAGLTLVIAGGLLMWLAPEVMAGIVLLDFRRHRAIRL